MRIFGDSISGNCLKVKWTADHLSLPYDWIEIDIRKGESRSPAFLAMNRAGQVPVVQLDDGRAIAQSNAILLHLGRGSRLIPADPFEQTKMLEWLIWEQYSHEPYIAVARFQVVYQGKSVTDLEPRLIERGKAALGCLEDALGDRRFLVGDGLTLADISLVAYTRTAHHGGFDLADYPAVHRWVGQVEQLLGLDPAA
jgi:glutathione S-transferase